MVQQEHMMDTMALWPGAALEILTRFTREGLHSKLTSSAQVETMRAAFFLMIKLQARKEIQLILSTKMHQRTTQQTTSATKAGIITWLRWYHNARFSWVNIAHPSLNKMMTQKGMMMMKRSSLAATSRCCPTKMLLVVLPRRGLGRWPTKLSEAPATREVSCHRSSPSLIRRNNRGEKSCLSRPSSEIS